jgi:succinate-semialdehyde dehydrogenase/glutarate-semialdehyde dehydrogenase
MILQTKNPTTEAILASYTTLDKEHTYSLIEKGYQDYLAWKEQSFSQRAELMLSLAKILRKKKDKLALAMASEMGKPITQGQTEIEKCAWVCEHYAKEAESYLKPEMIQTEMQKTCVYHLPIGLILGIMPWNYPFWQVFRAAIPNLMAGNGFVLKHAPIVLGIGNILADLFIEAGFPKFIFQHVILDDSMAAKVIAHPHIAGVTFTGSAKVGRIVGSHASSALKRVVMELGGSDPYLVLPDADLELAAQNIVTSRLNNCGQVCIAAKRVITVGDSYESLLEKLKVLAGRYCMDDPTQLSTNLGPMARLDLRETLEKQVQKSIDMGAHLIMGGYIPNRPGFYYPPTILTKVLPGMPAFEEELFGPVITLIEAENEIEAIQLANATSYGLGAAVFTSDLAKGERIAKELEAGTCCVNAFVSSDPRVPFGGIKQSGVGRELGREGILEFVNIKTISIK